MLVGVLIGDAVRGQESVDGGGNGVLVAEEQEMPFVCADENPEAEDVEQVRVIVMRHEHSVEIARLG